MSGVAFINAFVAGWLGRACLQSVMVGDEGWEIALLAVFAAVNAAMALLLWLTRAAR